MHAWEWITSAQGWLKLDGLDYHAAHDLVGFQDIAWDVAGAAVELGLSEVERDQLAAALGQRIGRTLPLEFVAACEICYLGFQIGLWTMAQDRNNETERRRIENLLRCYKGHRAVKSLGITCIIS